MTLDPTAAGAHRFLSDTYADVRRREIARVSELLQAQMLQDININPVQPSLSETNLNIVTQGGPARAGFNEFTPLFEQNQTQLNVSGVAGNENTYGGEGVASMLYGRYSASVGAFGYTTDGWRKNNDNKQNIEDVYFQAAITPEVNAQVEFRRRRTDNGDLAFNFDPDFFSRTSRRNLDQDTYRAGVRYSPLPSSDFLLSFIYSDLRNKVTDSDGFSVRSRSKDQGTQTEGQYLYRRERFNLTTGFGYSSVDRNLRGNVEFGGVPVFADANTQQITEPRGYIYGNLNFPDPVTWTVGVSYDDFQHNDLKVEKVAPKFGVQWNITENLTLRGAVVETVKPALINNQTLEPTQVAGFDQLFDDTNGADAWRYAVGLDHRLLSNLFIGGEATWREVSTPILTFDANDSIQEKSDEQTHRTYVHWLPMPELTLSAEFVYDKFTAQQGFNTDLFNVPKKVVTYSVPLQARYFHPSGFFAGFGVTYVNQDVNRTEASGGPEGSDDFFYLNASVGYRLPKRLGIASFGVTNLLDENIKYQDDSYREFEDQPSIGPYFPERLFFGRITLNW